MTSIQRNLVLWVLGGLAVGVAAVLTATYMAAYSELNRIFDAELRSVAQAVHLREDWQLAGQLRIARPGFGLSVRAYDPSGRVYFETVLPSLPRTVPQFFDAGYSDQETEEGAWRVYTHVTPEGVVQVGQPVEARAALARELSLRMVAPELLLVPLLLALLAWALKRGLSPLKEISRRVRERDANRLDPLPTRDVPVELLPLIDQINALLARLSDSLDAQRRFVADAAHELRTPIAALSLQAQIAERAHRPEARGDAFGELKLGIARAGRMVEQLLNLARLEPGVPRDPAEPVDFAGLARDVVGGFAARADAAGVDLGVEAPRSSLVQGVEGELRSLLTNLVDNALRYAPRGSQVTVRVREAGGAVEAEVVDAGPGIPEEQRARVFERFQRLPGDPTRGSGLGLPIAKAIVERHEGEISLVDARPGLVARVRLPAASEAAPSERRRDVRREPPEAAPLRRRTAS